MNLFLLAPLILQGVFIAVDEIFFHRRRGLPAWEVWGHPLDSLTVAIPFGLIAFQPYGERALVLYAVLAVFSCVFITKDEFVHSRLCSPVEHWLHAVLFVLHPVVFLAGAQLWKNGQDQALLIQFSLVVLFMIYQILHWGRPWRWFQPKNEA